MPDKPRDDLQEITQKDAQYNQRMNDAQKAVRELLKRASKDVEPEPELQQETEIENDEELEDEEELNKNKGRDK